MERRLSYSPKRRCSPAQYMSYVNPDTLSGIGVSLKIVFAVVLGGHVLADEQYVKLNQ